jgi:outer membrane protein assembly factor BamE (lipoprotein component of BamABCDE complex)
MAPDRLEQLVQDVRPGMAQADVEAILGKPRFSTTSPDNGVKLNKWVTDRVIVGVRFDPTDRVTRIDVFRIPLWDRTQDLLKGAGLR